MKKKSYWYVWKSLIWTKKNYWPAWKRLDDDNMLKVVNKNNQISYHEVKETHLDEECHRQSDWWNLG